MAACADRENRDDAAPPLSTSLSQGDGDDGGNTEDTGATPTEEGADDGSEEEGDRLDLPPIEPPDDSCYAADLLFVIDNSGSMCEAQEGLASVVPQLVDSMFDSLPVGTDLHVGITTTSFSHGLDHNETACRAAEGPAIVEAAYITDELVDYNGYQGRLFEFEGQAFFSARTDIEEARGDLADWFSGAIVEVGCEGGAFDFPVAAAAYALDPKNEETNGGFLRDKGAALAIFVLTNETDHSPEGLTNYHQWIVDAKSECGGDECILTSGLLATNCIPDWDPPTPIWQFLNAFGEEPVWGDVYDFDNYATVVAQTLGAALLETCEEIDPIG